MADDCAHDRPPSGAGCLRTPRVGSFDAEAFERTGEGHCQSLQR